MEDGQRSALPSTDGTDAGKLGLSPTGRLINEHRFAIAPIKPG